MTCMHCGRELYASLTSIGWVLMSVARGNAYCVGVPGPTRRGVRIHQLEMTPDNVRRFLDAPDLTFGDAS